MRVSNRLNALIVRNANKPGRYADGGGLYLRVAEYPTNDGPTTSKNWVFRFERDGVERFMGLGSIDTLSLAEARLRARKARQAVLDGDDPIETRRARRMAARVERAKVVTFRHCAERYIAEHSKSWKNPAHAAQWPATLAAYVYPVIGHLPVGAIDTGLCDEVPRADLVGEAGDGLAGPRPDRARARLGEGARIPAGRESGEVARPSG